MPKRQCVFNDKLQEQFGFLKKCKKPGMLNKVECTECSAIFSIEHGGKADINQHIKTDRHRIACNAHKSQKVSEFLSPKTFDDAQKHLAANEGVFAYHICKHNHSMRSMDCTSQLIRKLYDKKFSCGKTKNAQIIKKVTPTIS